MKAKMSIQRKLTLFTMSAFLLPLTAWMLFAFSVMNERLYNTKLTAARTSLEHIGNHMTQTMESCLLSANQLSSDPTLLNLVRNRNQDRDVVGVYTMQIKPLITFVKGQNAAIDTIHVVHENETIFNLYDIFYRVENIEQYVRQFNQQLNRAQQQNIQYYPLAPAYDFFADGSSAFSSVDSCWYVRSVMRMNEMYRPHGVIEIRVANQALYASMDQFSRSSGEKICLLLEDGTLVHGDEMLAEPVVQMLRDNENEKNNADNVILTYPLESMRSVLVYALPRNSFSMTGTELGVLALLLTFSVLSMLFLTRLVSQRIFKRLTKLSNEMDAVGKFNHAADDGIFCGDEIERLHEHFQQMLERLKTANETEKQLIFNDLTNDLKPHLICNAMDMLNTQAERANQPRIASSARQISQYFRYSMLRDKNGVTLLSEVDDARNYLELINTMRESQIYLDVQLDEWSERFAESLIVPKMILQPLVDNAIRHGIKGAYAGLIRIRLRKMDGNLVVSVEDNGDGMDAETENKLRLAIGGTPQWETSGRRHVGITNVMKRMEIFFTGRYTLDFVTAPDEGSIFTLTFVGVENIMEE